MGAVAAVVSPSTAQYFWAIYWAQFLKAASFEVVAKLVEFVQMSCAEVSLRISDSMDSDHFFSLTPCHCASDALGLNQNAASSRSEVAEIGARGFIGFWFEVDSPWTLLVSMKLHGSGIPWMVGEAV